jgi:hypothetical protein
MFEQRMGQTYTEEVFRYFLRVERTREARARRSVLLLLVTLQERNGAKRAIPRAVADEIFSGVWLTVREVDFVGWFRQDRVAAAVLTQGNTLPAAEDCGRIAQRITRALHQRVAADIAVRLDVQIRQLRPRQSGPAS